MKLDLDLLSSKIPLTKKKLDKEEDAHQKYIDYMKSRNLGKENTASTLLKFQGMSENEREAHRKEMQEIKEKQAKTAKEVKELREAEEWAKKREEKERQELIGKIGKLEKKERRGAKKLTKAERESFNQLFKNYNYEGKGERSPYYYKTKGKGIVDTVKAFFTGRKDYPPNIRKFIEQNKDLTITNMRVGRRPIKSFITTVGNALTFGGLKDAMKKYSYDDLLHLWLEFTMSNGKSHIVEKDEVVKIGAVDNREGEKTNFMNVPIKNTVNVYDFFYKPLKEVGKNLIEYSAHKYNCQNFVMNLLKYSGNLNPELEKFIMQDVEKMLADPKFSLHKTFIKFITDAGAKIDVLKQGAGKNEMRGKGIIDWLKKHKNKFLGLAGLAGVYGIKALHHKYLINKAEKEANEMMDNYINRRHPKIERRDDEPDII